MDPNGFYRATRLPRLRRHEADDVRRVNLTHVLNIVGVEKLLAAIITARKLMPVKISTVATTWP
jgi:hypothetical protein